MLERRLYVVDLFASVRLARELDEAQQAGSPAEALPELVLSLVGLDLEDQRSHSRVRVLGNPQLEGLRAEVQDIPDLRHLVDRHRLAACQADPADSALLVLAEMPQHEGDLLDLR